MATRKKKVALEDSGTSEAFERLKKVILNEDPPAAIKALLAIEGEPERKALADPVYKLHRDYWAGRIRGASQHAYHNTPLAVLAVCELAQAKRVPLNFWWKFKEQLHSAYLAFLLRRKPAWIASWVNAQLEIRDTTLPWDLLESVMDAGIDLDVNSDAFIIHFGNRYNDVHRSLSSRLAARPALLELIPRLFEVSTSAFTVNYGSHRERWPHFETWGETLAKLAERGHVDRAQLLKISLEALNRDFPQGQLSAIAHFHESLKPTETEKAGLEKLYRELLGSPTSKVAGFAVKMCLSIKSLDQGAFLHAAVPAMRLPTKTVAVTLLKAAKKFANKSESLVPLAVGLATEALCHSDREVTEMARNWLTCQGEQLPDEEGAAIPRPSEDQIAVDLEGIDARWKRLFELETSELPGPITYQLHQMPFRLEPIEPIAGLTELIDTVAGAVEECRSGDDIERILDGLSRFGAERPADFQLRTEALRQRIVSMPASESIKGLVSGWGGMSLGLKDLLLTWLSGGMVVTPLPKWASAGRLFPFNQGRLREIAHRIVAQQQAPLLAAPTHRGGWVMPRSLVERMSSFNHEVHRYDLVAALLRMAPHGRDAARAEAAGLAGEEGRAVRWALGGDQGPRRTDRRGELWLAAGRAREPRDELTAQLGFEEPARRLEWTVVPGECPRWPDPPLKPEPLGGLFSSVKRMFVLVRPPDELDPVEAFYEGQGQAWNEPDTHGAWNLHWRSLLWPANLDAYWKLASGCLWGRRDSDSSNVFPNQVFLEPLFDPDRPWDEPVQAVLWLALGSKASEVRGSAVDLLIEGIADGRGHPTPLGESAARLLEGQALKPNRLAEGLRLVARTSELHRWTVARVVARLLRAPLPASGHHLLDLLLETADALEEPVRAALSGDKKGGKTGKLTARLLELPVYHLTPRIHALVVAARLNRARAWSQARQDTTGEATSG